MRFGTDERPVLGDRPLIDGDEGKGFEKLDATPVS
jgi:hypothetical protein